MTSHESTYVMTGHIDLGYPGSLVNLKENVLTGNPVTRVAQKILQKQKMLSRRKRYVTFVIGKDI